MKVKELRDASNRLTIIMSDFPAWKYFWLKYLLKKKFKLIKTSKTYHDFDSKFQELYNAEGSVSIDWDIWGGFMVTALDKQSEPLVYEMMGYLISKYE